MKKKYDMSLKICPCNFKSTASLKYDYKNKFKLENLTMECTSDNHLKPKIYKCKKCDLLFSEFASVNFSQKYQEVEDKKYIAQIPNKEIYFRELFKNISDDINFKGRSLEIGAYYGVFSKIAKENISNLTSIELSNHAISYGTKNYNLNYVNKNPILFLKKNLNQFDNIFLFDVIEHLDDPFQFLLLISKNLKKDGKFIFTTFDMDTFFPKLTNKNYHWIMPMHKFYFSKKTLDYWCKISGLKIYKIKNDKRIVSLNYLFYKFSVLFPKLKFLFNYLSKLKISKKINININLNDLKIFFVKKIND